MPRLPVVSGKELLKFFVTNGFVKVRQTGSHMILEKDGVARPVVITNKKEVFVGDVKSNLRTAGISEQEFIDAFRPPKKSRR